VYCLNLNLSSLDFQFSCFDFPGVKPSSITTFLQFFMG
jgi:hypothetical protein